MQTKIKLLLLAGACSLALTGVAQAAGTNTMDVTANINGACGFQLGASLLDFGDLDTTATTDETATVDIEIWCTVGTVASVALGQGANHNGSTNRLANGTNYIPYTLSENGNGQTGAGKSSPMTMTVTGTIANANYVNAAVGAYTDTVTLTITP